MTNKEILKHNCKIYTTEMAHTHFIMFNTKLKDHARKQRRQTRTFCNEKVRKAEKRKEDGVRYRRVTINLCICIILALEL